ncbi:phytanoyl-CoA dioxygenase, partial [Streptomyces sp. SID8455]|nr:phytanoyl-CoA dioxygenase [Streptomyces sp. SID8455]
TPTPRRRPRLHRAASDLPYFSADGESYLAQTTLRELKKSRPLRVLSEEDFAHWQTYGYVIVREAVPAAVAGRLLDFTWDF